MIDPTGSQVSRSSISSPQSQYLYKKLTKAQTYMFPLFDSMTQHVVIPQIIYYPFILLFGAQLVSTSIRTFCSHWSGNEKVKTFMQIPTLTQKDTKLTVMLIPFITYIAISVFTLCFLISLIFVFSTFRRYPISMLYIYRLLGELVSLVMIYPMTRFVGISILELISNGATSMNLIYLVCTVLFTIFEYIVFYQTYLFIDVSPYLGNSPLMTFDSNLMKKMATFLPIFSLADVVASFYPEWVDQMVVVLHIVFVLYLKYLSYQRPFIRNSTNIFFDFILLLMTCYDIIDIVLFFASEHNIEIIRLVFIFSVPISLFVEILKYQLLTKSKKSLLLLHAPDDCPYPIDEDRVETLLNLKCDKNEKLAIFYYNFTLANQLKQWMDFLFLKFLIEHYSSLNILIRCLKTTTYFPPEYRLTNLILGTIEKNTKFPIQIKFLIFQVQKINTLRQSASSSLITERFHEISSVSKEVFYNLSRFWSKTSCSTEDLIAMYQHIDHTRARWEEIIADFPNSPEYYKYYAYYLLDCCTDFKESIDLSYKARLIEEGLLFAKDLCFIYFVRNFPVYLKSKIIDFKGTFAIKTISKDKRSSSKDGNSINKSNLGCSDIDTQLEETIGKHLSNNFKLQLALQNATVSKKPKLLNLFMVYSIFSFFVSVVFSVFFYLFFHNYFKLRTQVSERLELSNLIRFNYFSSLLSTIFIYGTKTKKIDISKTMKVIREFEKGENAVFPASLEWELLANIFNVDARGNYSALMQRLADIANTENIYRTAKIYLDEEVSLFYCSGGNPTIADSANLKTVLSYGFLTMSLLGSYKNYDEWFNNNQLVCHLYQTASTIGYFFSKVGLSLMESSNIDVKRSGNDIKLVQNTIPTLFILISLVGQAIVMLFLNREIKKFSSFLLSFKSEVKTEAAKSIHKSSNLIESKGEEEQSVATKRTYNLLMISIVSLSFCFSLCLTFLIHVLKVRDSNNEINDGITWLMYARSRKSLAIEACLWGHMLILFGDGMQSNFTNVFLIGVFVEYAISDLLSTSHIIESGDKELPSVIGVSEMVDYYELSEQCEINTSRTTIHEFYRCGSMANLNAFLRDMLKEIRIKNEHYKGKIVDEVPTHLLELVTDHLCYISMKVDGEIRNIVTKISDDWEKNNLFLFVVELILSFFILFCMLRLKKLYEQAYMTLIILLRRINPISLIQNEDLMNYLMNRNSRYIATKSTGHSIFNASPDAIICTSINGMIEIINPAVTSILGYSPDQILGQTIVKVIDLGDQEKIMTQISMMEHGQASLVHEDHVRCVSDTGSKIQCSLTLIGMSDDKKGISSFTAILRDETSLLVQQEEAEQAKNKSEMLLYQILPRDIVSRLNQGEKDISFVVPSSTIMFIDIVKFSEYSSTLTPTEIMEQLSSVFEIYDEHLKKYPLLTKIKLIGDVYMCAGGLFNHENPPNSHAQQMVRFGLDCIISLDEFNLHKNTLLSIRVGVNTGGPLIAGVLGTDKPTFDIIGDPINIASRLQSTGIPGQIQVSQDTHDLIADMDIDIQCRGEIMLKGKGRSTSYIITPRRIGLFNAGTSEEMIGG